MFALSTTDPGDEKIREAGPRMFLMGAMMVMAQCMVLPRLFISFIYLPCSHNDDCTVPGMFCANRRDISGQTRAQCGYCGTWAPLDWQYDPITGDSYNFPEDDLRHIGFNASHALEVCTDHTKSVGILRAGVNGEGTDGYVYSESDWGPPLGRGNHPSSIQAYNCFDIRGGPEPPCERVQVMCPGATAMGEPAPDFEIYISRWCARCIEPLTGNVDGLTAWLLQANHVNAMAKFDYV